MIAALRSYLQRRRFRQAFAHYDEAISACRRAHGPVNKFIAAKQEAVHAALRRAAVEKAMAR